MTTKPPAHVEPGKKTRPGDFACIGLDLESNERADSAGAAMATWTWALLYTRRRGLDGFVPASAIKRAWVGEKQARRDVGVLLRVGLFAAADHPELGPGWQLLRYAEWNDTREELENRRQLWRKNKRENRLTSDISHPRNYRGNSEMSYETNPRTTTRTNGWTPSSSTDLRSSSSKADLGVDLQHARVSERAPAREAGPNGTGEALLPVETTPPSNEAGPCGPFATPPAHPDTPAPETRSEGNVEGVARRPRDWGTRRFEQSFFTTAYADGVCAAVGVPYVVPRGELRELDDAIDTYAPLEDRETWVRESAAAFRRAVHGREQFHRGAGPRGWLEWLGMGSPSAEWLAASPDERARERAEETRRKAARARERAERERQRAEEERAAREGRISPEEARATLARLFAPKASNSS